MRWNQEEAGQVKKCSPVREVGSAIPAKRNSMCKGTRQQQRVLVRLHMFGKLLYPWHKYENGKEWSWRVAHQWLPLSGKEVWLSSSRWRFSAGQAPSWICLWESSFVSRAQETSYAASQEFRGDPAVWIRREALIGEEVGKWNSRLMEETEERWDLTRISEFSLQQVDSSSTMISVENAVSSGCRLCGLCVWGLIMSLVWGYNKKSRGI